MNFKYRKQPLKKKPKSDAKAAEEKLWKWFSIFIRLRDADKNGICRCFTCGRFVHWRSGDCGHGIPRQHKGTKYDERNCQFQCKKCNGFEQGQQDIFAHNVDVKYGKGTWDKLLIQSRKACHRGLVDYVWMAEHYEQEAQKLAQQKGITI